MQLIRYNRIHTRNLKYIQYLFLIIIIIGTSWPYSSLHAQDNPNVNKVPTSVPVLRISPDTRSAGLGEAGLATSPDAASGMLNTSKIVFGKADMGISVDYAPWLRDISSDSYLLSLGGYQKLDDRQAVSASLRYFTSGKVEERDYNNNLLQLITPNEFLFDAGYARKLSEKLSIGIAFRYIHSSIGRTVNNTAGTGSAFAADLSAYYTALDENGQGFTAGFIIGNIGTGKINYGGNGENDGFLPAKIGAGVGYTFPIDNDQKVIITGELNKSLVPIMPAGDNGYTKFKEYSVMESYAKGIGNGAMSFSAGAEYEYQELFSVRAGYFGESEVYGGRKYFSAGAGLNYKKAGINIAYIFPSGSGINRNALSNTLRLGLFFFPGK